MYKKPDLDKLFPRATTLMPFIPNYKLGQRIDEVYYDSYDPFILDVYGDECFLAMKKDEIDEDDSFDFGEWRPLPQFDIDVKVFVALDEKIWGEGYCDEFYLKEMFQNTKS